MMNCFIIQGKNGLVLVDTGVPGSSRKIFEEINNHGFSPSDIRLIVVTHGHMDHFGSVGEINRELKVPVLAHQLDTPFYEKGEANVATMKPTVLWAHLFKRLVKGIKTRSFTPDIIMDQEEYDLNEWVTGAKIIHTPGHTAGSISVVLPNKEAIIMDMMSSGVGLGGIMLHSRVKHPAFHDDLSLLKQSFDKILAYDLDVFYLGHGKPVSRQQVLKYVDKYLKSY
ncbi:MBL fold metallo-hydrolase [Marinoscillum pacificum]|uniref:MBL fold metallo-hydrolase n=1 Tax=Marinoscillum pacificum TaxID=392723 RepID=UPI0021587560|nr:MBL fold metallo-hydrolase [Marinoscillum pacificum]